MTTIEELNKESEARRTLTLGSLFDGVGGWQLAAVRAGVKPVWSSEIEAFPLEVTKRHFPDTIQLGDVTKLDGADIPPVDIICAGSPCQDLSVAGKRVGLAGERSGLFVQAINIVRQMRRATGGQKPRFFVWENVPGAFSSNKRQDFRTVLEEIGQATIPMPRSGRWADAGLVRTKAADIAWRVLDAQYWGVPQRRKRIFLVADFAETGRRAAEILFEPEGVQGDTPQGEGTRESIAKSTGTSTYSAVLRMRSGKPGGGKGALVSTEKSLTLATNNDQTVFSQVKIFDMTHANNPVQSYNGEKCHTLTSRMGTGGNQVPVLHYYTIAGNTIGRTAGNGGNGNGFQEGISYTLNTTDRHAVVSYASQSYTEWKEGEPMTTLRASGGFNGGGSENLATYNGNTVRRLTPLECERLQGYPDGWTDIGFHGKPAPDSRRYKAIGNGMAQPCADFILRRIEEEAGMDLKRRAEE